MTGVDSGHSTMNCSANGWGKYYFWLQGLVIYISSLLITGYQIYSANHEVQIPFVLWNKNPALFSGDPLISTFNHYIGPVWLVVAYFSTLIPLETLLLLLFLATRALILFAAARLALAILPGSKLAALGAMAFFALAPSPLVGHGTLVLNYFEHTAVSVALLLLSLAAFYSQRPLCWALWLILGFYLNVLYGFYACLFFAAVFLLDSSYRTRWKKWALPSALFLLLTIPVMLPKFLSFQKESVDVDLWLRASEVRHSFHLFPHTWRVQQFVVFFGFLVVYLLVLYLYRKELGRLFSTGLIFTGMSISWLILSFLAAYVIRSPALLVIQPARGTDLWFAFGTISMIVIFAHNIELNNRRKRLSVLLFFTSILWLSFFYFPTFIMALLSTLLAGVILPPLWRYIFGYGKPSRLANLVVLTILIISTYKISLNYKQNNLRDLIRYPDHQMVDVALWAKDNTDLSDMFLIDPNWEGFRALSQRPVYVTWKDGTAIFWKLSFAGEWVARFAALGLDVQETQELGTTMGSSQLGFIYNKLKDDDILQLMRTYPIKYWVVQVDKFSAFPVVYQTEKYKILNLKICCGERVGRSYGYLRLISKF